MALEGAPRAGGVRGRWLGGPERRGRWGLPCADRLAGGRDPAGRPRDDPGVYNFDHCRTPFLRADVSETQTWMCLICGWIYDEAAGDPEHGIAPGTAWADVPMNWTCPECGARKEDFEMVRI